MRVVLSRRDEVLIQPYRKHMSPLKPSDHTLREGRQEYSTYTSMSPPHSNAVTYVRIVRNPSTGLGLAAARHLGHAPQTRH